MPPWITETLALIGVFTRFAVFLGMGAAVVWLGYLFAPWELLERPVGSYSVGNLVVVLGFFLGTGFFVSKWVEFTFDPPDDEDTLVNWGIAGCVFIAGLLILWEVGLLPIG